MLRSRRACDRGGSRVRPCRHGQCENRRDHGYPPDPVSHEHRRLRVQRLGDANNLDGAAVVPEVNFRDGRPAFLSLATALMMGVPDNTVIKGVKARTTPSRAKSPHAGLPRSSFATAHHLRDTVRAYQERREKAAPGGTAPPWSEDWSRFPPIVPARIRC